MTSSADAAHPDPSTQARYQVRLDGGVAGARRIAAGADVIVWVDALPSVPPPTAARRDEVLATMPARPAVVSAGLADAPAVADWILALQTALGRRAYVAVVAAGTVEADGSWRACAEDQLAAGAVVDALAALGIDATSPEAAVACAAYQQRRPAVGHLVTASVSARRLDAAGHGGLVAAALAAGPVDVVVHRLHRDA
ncbi:2-phosphosulfolactate phosphatase [Clavibacter michiganensis]|uniref:2-phosphosulfolactate phosphatase n=1 Tax=Clavibacter michiganensis TaxID=28447 RepID=UPI0026DC5C74|nr:2-phosphosulfolactate phosphatase [Clavibacter michiganensis]MDO4065206.1 2-phosphosulfolactate phosphatase [Clavibacter michiganensis]MDO4071031.1 2-phosphosulfolactate phosphatase [Clavibacter michiganensis]MDO4089451.1 2-phosphosulfolactate phosphatase [Clavibacter michiganensis]